jgi:hypothetical protein
MPIAWNDKPECKTFESRLMPLVSEFLTRHSMKPLGDIWYFGVDPKSGGRLFLAHFQGDRFWLKVRTSDAAADVLVGLPGASTRWVADGWFSLSQVAQASLPWAPEPSELMSLRDRLNDVGWF